MGAPRRLSVLTALCCAFALLGLLAATPGSALTLGAISGGASSLGSGTGTSGEGATGVVVQVVEPQPVNPVIEAEWEAKVKEWQERGKLAVGAQDAEVRLTPGLEGGWVGWCMTLRVNGVGSTHCPVTPRSEEVAYERWEAAGAATRGVALVNAPAEAVAVDYADSAVAAVPVEGVPGLSAAVVELAAPFPAKSGWFDEFDPVSHDVRTSGARGYGAPENDYSVSLPTAGWQAPQEPPAGACSLVATRLPGLRPRFGHVATSLSPTPGVAGGGFASCADTEYSFGRSSLDAAILLDADEPGLMEPAELPGATRVHHHPGLFSAPGWNGEILARRVGEAWLAVEGGASLRQRIEVLAHLRPRVGA